MDETRNEITEMEQTKEYQLFRLSGKLTYGYTQESKEAILEKINPEATNYVFDLTAVKMVDSTGMGLFITFLNYIDSDKTTFLIIENSFIRELFTIAKLNKLFIICSSLEEAQRKVKEGREL
ncbi:STAS domain-containing protein [Metabacillus sp. YM-086]|uniref:STAS domain-containing protein n=1 Tax=Metabacillus TaxID=2675233 RepID=UPI0020410931|nr:STAS domain-containing protein [Metabacillus litoralis]MCM3412163.1 STAS domain-containing protein [Metabacillus litoralis]